MRERLAAAGFVDVRELDERLLVVLRHAGDDNTMGEAVYGEVRECYLRAEAAAMLARAAQRLAEAHPGLRLMLADCLRPREVQRRMWSLVVGTPRQSYVANPEGGSLHNYGGAVDITLADEHGRELDLGTPMHHFGPLAQPRFEARFRAAGALTPAQLRNRDILRRAMTSAGFHGLRHEWWHFEAFDIKTARRRYRMVESFAAPDGLATH